MPYAQIQRAFLENVVGRYLDEIRLEPKRSLRNLVDLGREAACGKLQQGLLELIQRMLKRRDSPYYALVQNAVRTVERQRLLTFGVNLGWNSLVQGAKRIRRLEGQRRHKIPWALAFHLARGAAGESPRLIAEGMPLGIYSYCLLPEDGASVEAALELAAANQECAFCLLLPQGYEVGPHLSALGRCPNVILGVDSRGDGWERAAGLLRENHFLYLPYRRYRTRSDMEEIVSGAWAERILPWAGIAALLISDLDEAGGTSTQAVRQYARDARMDQRYPTLIFDCYPDFLYTGGCVSGYPCFLSILPDGTAAAYRDGREQPLAASAEGVPLDDLLGQLFPI